MKKTLANLQNIMAERGELEPGYLDRLERLIEFWQGVVEIDEKRKDYSAYFSAVRKRDSLLEIYWLEIQKLKGKGMMEIIRPQKNSTNGK